MTKKEQLKLDAEELGIKVNGTCGEKRIQDEIDEKLLEDVSEDNASDESDELSEDKKSDDKSEDKPKAKGKSMTLVSTLKNPININGLRFKGKETKKLTSKDIAQGGKRLNHAIEIGMLVKVKGA